VTDICGAEGGTTVPVTMETAEFERLYRRWRPDVLSLCRRLLGSAEEAEDAAQEAFLRAWAARERYSTRMPFWPWLAAIARRICLDRRRRWSALSVRDPHLATASGPEQAVVVNDELRAVVGVLEAMRPREHRVLVRRELDGWSYGRIAAVEGVSVEAVRSSLKRARACLRSSLIEDEAAKTGRAAIPRTRTRD